MQLNFGKSNIQVYRNTWRDTAISRNIGFGEVNRLDRETLGLAFAELRLRWIVLAFYREIRPAKPLTVGDRGVW